MNSKKQEKLSLIKYLEQIKNELSEKLKEIEIHEINRYDLQAQCTKFLEMINQKVNFFKTNYLKRKIKQFL